MTLSSSFMRGTLKGKVFKQCHQRWRPQKTSYIRFPNETKANRAAASARAHLTVFYERSFFENYFFYGISAITGGELIDTNVCMYVGNGVRRESRVILT